MRLDPALPDNILARIRNMDRRLSVVERRTGKGFPVPRFFRDGITDGAATTPTAFGTHNDIVVAPRDMRMWLVVGGHLGGNGAANRITLQLYDQQGTSLIASGFDGQSLVVTNNVVNDRRPISIVAYRDYNKGDACGYDIRYAVDTSNVYISALVRVDFTPIP